MTGEDKTQELELARSLFSSGELRHFLIDLWRKIRIDWTFAGDRLQQSLRNRRSLNSRTRRWVGDVLYGMIRNLRRIDAGLKAGGVRMSSAAPDELRVAAYLMLEGPLSAQDVLQHLAGSPAARRVDWEAVASIDRVIDADTKPWRRLAIKFSFPDWLAKRFLADLGDDAFAFAEAVNRRAPLCVRANVPVSSVQQLEAAFEREGIVCARGRYADHALRLGAHRDVHTLEEFRNGGFELQDEASQVVAELALALAKQVSGNAKPLMVDYCAGAGGKLLAWASRVGNRGRLIACDTDGGKLAALRKRARRARVTNAHTIVLDETSHAMLDELYGAVPCVLVDAPCSGLGTLRRHPEIRWRVTTSEITRLAALQAEILSSARNLVAPGGMLVYATCTVTAAENRRVVEAFLSRHREFALRPLSKMWPERAAAIADTNGTYMFMTPHRHDTDGFFAAVLQREPHDARV